MALSPEALDALLKAGATAEMIVAAVSADLRAEAAAAEVERSDRRAREAARKKGYREMVAAQRMSRDVPQCPVKNVGQPGTNGTSGDSIPSEEVIPPSPPTGAQTPTGVSSRRGAILPTDWAPKPGHFDRGAAEGRDERWVLDQAEAMREWAESNSNRSVARKANWDRTFDGWLRRAFAKPSNANGARAGPKPQRPMSMFDATIDLLAEIHDKHH